MRPTSILTDTRYSNPYCGGGVSPEQAAGHFDLWVQTQADLLRFIQTNDLSIPTEYQLSAQTAHMPILAEIKDGLWDAPPEPIFVFGSNLAGKHGKGAALHAARHNQAESGIGEGPTGSAYAIPTKGMDLEALPIQDALAGIDRFFEYASTQSGTTFRLTRVGCGLAGLDEPTIRDHVLQHRPANVEIPGTWLHAQTGFPRVIVAGSRGLASCSPQSKEQYQERLDKLLANLTDPTIVSGAARGADLLGEAYAVSRGLSLYRFPALWEKQDKAAGFIRNQQMSWYGSHLIALWDGKSPGTRAMIDLAKRDGLSVRVLSID